MKFLEKIKNDIFKCLVYIYFLDILVYKNSIFKSTKYVLKLTNSYIFAIKKLHLKLPFTKFTRWLFIKYIVKKVSLSPNNSYILKKLWLDYFKETSDENIKMALSKLFYLCNLIDDEVTENIIRFAQTTSNHSYRYWTTMDISYMTFISQKGTYPNYYQDRKNLLKQIAQENYFYIEPQQPRKNINDCLCIITHQLEPNLYHSIQRVAVMISNELYSKYKEIQIICLDSFYISPKEETDINMVFTHDYSYEHSKEITDFYKDNVKVYSPVGETFKERLQNVLNKITEINPNVILDMSDEFSPISYNYSQCYKTIYMPIRNYVSSSFFSYFLTHKEFTRKINKLYSDIININAIKEWYIPEYIPEKKELFTKSKLGFSDDKFIIVSIGNNSFDSEFIDKFSILLKQQPNIIWLLVGTPATEYMHTCLKEFFRKQQVIEWGFESNLSGLCNACDIALRPNYSGGSGGTAIAAQMGLPIVMTSYICDASRWLGPDYSQIDTYQVLVNEIEKLYTNHDYYLERQRITSDKVKMATDAASKWTELANILLKA